MVVPCNTKLKAGDVIHAEFPAIEVTDKKKVDNPTEWKLFNKRIKTPFRTESSSNKFKTDS